jgi:hypothetical protein
MRAIAGASWATMGRAFAGTEDRFFGAQGHGGKFRLDVFLFQALYPGVLIFIHALSSSALHSVSHFYAPHEPQAPALLRSAII